MTARTARTRPATIKEGAQLARADGGGGAEQQIEAGAGVAVQLLEEQHTEAESDGQHGTGGGVAVGAAQAEQAEQGTDGDRAEQGAGAGGEAEEDGSGERPPRATT